MTDASHSPTNQPTRAGAALAARRHLTATRIATLVALSVLFAWLSASALGATETPDLSGSWQMDKELTAPSSSCGETTTMRLTRALS